MKGKVLFLGTGSSMGVPCIACHCPVCTSPNEHNKRLRPSVLIMVNNKILLVDVSPDFRTQALKNDINNIDGALLTHSHFDHIGGIEELRVFYFKNQKSLPILLSKDTFKDLKKRFYYLFRPRKEDDNVHVKLSFELLRGDFGKVSFQTVNIEYLSYYQGSMKVTGFIIGNMAYITDIKQYDERVIRKLQGIDILILSALRKELSRANFNLVEAKQFAKKIKAKQVWLTHLAHDIEYEKTKKHLPDNINLGFDGLELGFNYA